jgi:hypothetical protein
MLDSVSVSVSTSHQTPSQAAAAAAPALPVKGRSKAAVQAVKDPVGAVGKKSGHGAAAVDGAARGRSAKAVKVEQPVKAADAAKSDQVAKVAKPGKVEKAAKVSKPAKAVKETKLDKTPKAAAAAAPAGPKLKLVRDSFTMPELEYAQLEALKRRALALAHHAKKSELLRAGIATLAAMDDAQLLQAMQAVPPLKTGRPRQG